MQKEILQNALKGERIKKSFSKAHTLDILSGPGLLRKIKRLFFLPEIYIPYLFTSKMHIDRESTSYLFWGKKIKIPLRDYDALALHIYGFAGGNEQELRLVKFLIKNITENDIFYDIGANYGFYTYLAEELCKEIHTFEPIPKIAEVVTKNTSKASNIFVNNVALSDTTGSVDLYMSESSGLSTINVSTIKTHTYTYSKSNKITVPTVTLDGYIAKHAKPTFLKIDVEGAEELVIKGGKIFFIEHSPTISLEIWSSNNGGEISMKAVEELRAIGYESFSINNNGDMVEASGYLSRMVASSGGDNFIFKKKKL